VTRRPDPEAGTAPPADPARAYARRLAAASIADGDDTGWFETLYAAAEHGDATVPWADLAPNPHIVSELAGRTGDGPALVIGCGLGDDAEHVASRGYATLAFDVSPTAVTAARRRFPDSAVEYVTADLLSPPLPWAGAFDLVVEAYTLQVLTGDARRTGIARTADLVAPGGRLLVVARARDEHDDPGTMPASPWERRSAGEVEQLVHGVGIWTGLTKGLDTKAHAWLLSSHDPEDGVSERLVQRAVPSESDRQVPRMDSDVEHPHAEEASTSKVAERVVHDLRQCPLATEDSALSSDAVVEIRTRVGAELRGAHDRCHCLFCRVAVEHHAGEPIPADDVCHEVVHVPTRARCRGSPVVLRDESQVPSEGRDGGVECGQGVEGHRSTVSHAGQQCLPWPRPVCLTDQGHAGRRRAGPRS
jgi:SAM-dependent methyltransferase